MITPERSPRPTSAPAIAQSHPADPAPAKSDVKDVATSKAGKETAKPDVRREEFSPEKPKEPVDASRVGQSGVSWEEPSWGVAQGVTPKQQLCPGRWGLYPSPQCWVGAGTGVCCEIPAMAFQVEEGAPGQLGVGGCSQSNCSLLLDG